ncbi:DNA-binding response regulator [candidate division KSB3 bacterium]|uniref:DNA-binding response regulator n=1 Tax=candidate division KSB3 bacterium TaxID=2044937 RepID=A0A2G6E4M9_9BACT|nr:MAG: DNA-binding response regulator [candidate division KSB3 bacterium]PIE29376.1 MAG: DNA-binding response regulator [candidate division KSB3 bacterium]
MEGKILIVDDEAIQREIVRDILEDRGCEVIVVGSGVDALEYIKHDPVDVVLTDLRMPGMDGVELLEHIKDCDPEIVVVVVTAYGSLESAVDAVKKGAYDYLAKPLGKEQLTLVVERALSRKKLSDENRSLRQELQERHDFHNIIGRSPKMQDVFKMIEKIAPSESTVIIYGESGTGKELVARALHYHSKRKDRRFLAVNCAAIPDSLLESEMFGHEKGAFTGAHSQKKGLFEEADNSTLFLDEIGDLDITLQAKLLRVLQEGEFQRVGGTQTIRVNVRLLAATNKELEEEVKEGRFRQDLYYRLNVVPIYLPPLRARREDISYLAQHFLTKYNAKHGKAIQSIASNVTKRLMDYRWEGNVRELESVIERSVILSDHDRIEIETLPEKLQEAVSPPAPQDIRNFRIPDEGISLEHLERSLIESALKKSNWSIKRASELLGISYKTLQYRIQKYHLKD